MRIVKEIHWPEISNIKKLKPTAAIARIHDFLMRMRKVQAMRDKKIAQAINTADIQVVQAIPTDAPDQGSPTLVVYHSGSTYRLYIYVDGGWRYSALT